MERPRFELEWLMPRVPGLTTHVTLFDNESPPHYIRAVGHGADEADTLLDLWIRLVDRHEPTEALCSTRRTSRSRRGNGNGSELPMGCAGFGRRASTLAPHE